jgi:hypothetical protein
MRQFGWRQTKLAAACVALALLPASAWAHAGERGVILLLPTGYAIAGGTLAVAASFIILSFIPDAWVRRFSATSGPVPAAPVGAGLTISTISFLFLAILVAAGFLGTRDPLENPLPLVVWTLWWGGLTIAQAALGNLWTVLNPWIAPARLLRRILALRRPPLAYPQWLGLWPAVLFFLAFAWFELVDPAPDDPDRLALAVVIYSAITVGGMLLFGEEVWLSRAEAFTVFFRFVAMLAPVQPNNEGRLRLTWPGAMLVRAGAMEKSASAFVLLTLATVSFDGLSRTFWWLGLAGINPLEFPGRTAVIGLNTLGLVLAWAALAAAYAAAVWAGARLAVGRQGLSELFGLFVLSILPISVVYHAAHYLPALLVNAQYAVYAFNDPFARGWHLLGLGEPNVTVSFLTDYQAVALIWSIEAGLIVLGHMLAVWVAHMIAVERFGARIKAIRSELPLAALMVAYTTFGLWLLSTPTAV